MNSHRDAMCKSLDLTTCKGKLANAVIKQGRARGLRGDTWQYTKARHLDWEKIVTEECKIAIRLL